MPRVFDLVKLNVSVLDTVYRQNAVQQMNFE